MKRLNYVLSEGVLTVENRVVTLPYPTAQALNFNELVVVRVEPDIGKIYNKNIFALDGDGKIKWQIAESPHGTEVDKPYTSIFITTENELLAGNWNGVDYIVSAEDGSISTKSFNK